MSYRHTQSSYWLPILAGLGAVIAGLVLWLDPRAVGPALAIVGAMLAVGAVFGRLTIAEEGPALRLRFGPLPLLHKSFPYADIRRCAADRTTLADGWGIHWVPRRGWTYNVWGWQCVRLELANGKTIRLGTDDVEGLLAHLRQRLSVSDRQQP